MKVKRNTLLASGYTLMYPIVIAKGKLRYYFLGLIAENLATTIMCNSADDCHYRVDVLNESEFYQIGGCSEDRDRLNKAARIRVNKEEFVIGIEMPVDKKNVVNHSSSKETYRKQQESFFSMEP